jgi:hypothetical protein
MSDSETTSLLKGLIGGGSTGLVLAGIYLTYKLCLRVKKSHCCGSGPCGGAIDCSETNMTIQPPIVTLLPPAIIVHDEEAKHEPKNP